MFLYSIFTSVYLHTTGGIQKDKMFERIFIQDLYVESEDLFILGLASIKPPSPPPHFFKNVKNIKHYSYLWEGRGGVTLV